MKNSAKIFAALIAAVAILPAYLLYRIGQLVLGADRAFPGWSQLFSLIPGFSGAYLRRAFYGLVFHHCGDGTFIGFGTVFSHRGCWIGRNVYVGVFCCLGEVTLEDDVLIGSHVSIMNGSEQHGIDRLDLLVREQPGRWPHVSCRTGHLGRRPGDRDGRRRPSLRDWGWRRSDQGPPGLRDRGGCSRTIVGYRKDTGPTRLDRPLTEVV